MHDISLGITVRDYLTGEEIEATTYEDLRQGLSRLLVEELGYPRNALRPRVPVCFPIEGREYSRVADLAAFSLENDAGAMATDMASDMAGGEDAVRVPRHGAEERIGGPLLVVIFCSGTCQTYRREALAAAWLFPGGPAPLVAVTDCRDASLYATGTGRELGTGMRALPRWDQLAALAAEHAVPALDEERAARERRVLYAYSEMLYGCCAHATCAVESKGGRWAGKGDGGSAGGDDDTGSDDTGSDDTGSD